MSSPLDAILGNVKVTILKIAFNWGKFSRANIGEKDFLCRQTPVCQTRDSYHDCRTLGIRYTEQQATTGIWREGFGVKPPSEVLIKPLSEIDANYMK